MSRVEHLCLWLLPTLFLTTATVFYFSGVPALVSIVCPTGNREWGILENVQLLTLVGILVLAVQGLRTKPTRPERIAYGLLAIFTVWVFLEEIDYGAHFVQLFTGEKRSYLEELTGVYNLHHQGITDKIYKRSSYIVMAVLFLLAPVWHGRFRHPLLVYLTPSPRIAVVAVLSIVSDLTPRLIVGLGILPDAGLGKNIGEFSEVMVYYTFLVYVFELVHHRSWGTTPTVASGGTHTTSDVLRG